jgi:bifunctional isochorismate lyase/aryl carrier protein
MPPLEKEAYFTPENLASQAQELLHAPGVMARKAAPAFNPRLAALLVLDMQLYFLEPGSHAYIPSAAAILPGINRLIRGFNRRSLPVFYTRHTNTPEDAGLMASWWRDLIDPDEARSQITPQLGFTQGVIIEKNHYDAFYDSALEEHLHWLGVSQVVITGVMTHLCCETTARSAFMRGFQPFFLVDGTATYHRYYHIATLTNLAHGFARLALVQEILDALEGE